MPSPVAQCTYDRVETVHGRHLGLGLLQCDAPQQPDASSVAAARTHLLRTELTRCGALAPRSGAQTTARTLSALSSASCRATRQRRRIKKKLPANPYLRGDPRRHKGIRKRCGCHMS